MKATTAVMHVICLVESVVGRLRLKERRTIRTRMNRSTVRPTTHPMKRILEAKEREKPRQKARRKKSQRRKRIKRHNNDETAQAGTVMNTVDMGTRSWGRIYLENSTWADFAKLVRRCITPCPTGVSSFGLFGTLRRADDVEDELFMRVRGYYKDLLRAKDQPIPSDSEESSSSDDSAESEDERELRREKRRGRRAATVKRVAALKKQSLPSLKNSDAITDWMDKKGWQANVSDSTA